MWSVVVHCIVKCIAHCALCCTGEYCPVYTDFIASPPGGSQTHIKGLTNMSRTSSTPYFSFTYICRIGNIENILKIRVMRKLDHCSCLGSAKKTCVHFFVMIFEFFWFTFLFFSFGAFPLHFSELFKFFMNEKFHKFLSLHCRAMPIKLLTFLVKLHFVQRGYFCIIFQNLKIPCRFGFERIASSLLGNHIWIYWTSSFRQNW